MEEETSTQTESTESATVVDTAPTGGEVAKGSWSYDENTVGTGEKPDWYKSDKYKSVSDQAKAYTDLESRFGGFTGAPEEYTVNDDVDYETDSPLFSKLQELGKANNMSNEMFNSMISMYNEVNEQQYQEMQKTEFEALGSGAESRIKNVNDWAKANVPAELQDTFLDNIRTANDVKLAELFMDRNREQKVASPNTMPAQTEMTADRLREMQLANDEYGNRKMSVDPEYKKRVDKLMAEFYN